MQIEEDKRKIRLAAKVKRDSLTQTEISLWSDVICRKLSEQSFFQNAGTVCFYYPLGSEVNLLPLAKLSLESGKQTAFPRVNGSNMDFYRISSLEEFTEGAFHVMEPTGSDILCTENALILVPGLVFDAYGGRMGYGKGYYDRYFSRYPFLQKAGICYEMQKTGKVPYDEHDIFMDMVVTEQGICRCDNNQIKGG